MHDQRAAIVVVFERRRAADDALERHVARIDRDGRQRRRSGQTSEAKRRRSHYGLTRPVEPDGGRLMLEIVSPRSLGM